MKRLKPDVKIILVGDYNQLKPVNDRVSAKTDYENSPVVFELCDGNRIQLSKCRRSDDKIFNMCLPNNIDQIDTKQYGKDLCNISHTNEKRRNVNAELMLKYSKDRKRKKFQC